MHGDGSVREVNNAGISRSVIVLLSVTSAVTVANLYYAQPLLEELTRFFRVSPAVIGAGAMLIQVGYALGLFSLVPLGDIRERRSLIMTMLFCAMTVLVALSFAPNIWWFLVCSLLLGLTSIVPMLIVPLAAHLANASARGQVIGTVMGGLLVGILLSRTFAGTVGSMWGWQTVYRIAAGMMGALLSYSVSAFVESLPTRSWGTAGSSRPYGGSSGTSGS